MRQLWNRIRDYVILAALVLLSLVVMIQTNDPVFRVMRSFSLEVTSRVESRFAWVGSYLGALQENDALRATNIALTGQLALLRQAERENDRLKSLLELRDSTQYPTIAARAIVKDITRQKNTLTIDVGARDGVAVGMPVINEKGILGKVVFVSDRYALVQSYLNTDFRVPVQITPLDAFGIVRWEGRGRQGEQLLLEYVVKTTPVEKGQHVITSGSLSFPPGLAVGRVDTVITQPGQNELRILVEPAARIGEARYVFVIDLQPDEELVELQDTDR